MMRSCLALMLSGALLTLVGCDSSDFSGGNSTTNSGLGSGADGSGINGDELLGADGGFGEGSENELFVVQELVSPVDVVIAIDTSGSMTDENTYLQNNISTFLTNLQASKIDAKVIVVANPFTTTQPPDKVQVVSQAIGSRNAIGILNQQFAANALALRGTNPLEVVFVTDDNGRGSGNLAADFRPPTDRKVVVNGILGLKKGQDAENPACSIPNVGTEYMDLAKATKGSVFDLCAKDWNPLLKKLGESIIQRTRGFKLSQMPVVAKGFRVRTGSMEIPADKYTYDEASNTITISPDVSLKAGEKLAISYFPRP